MAFSRDELKEIGISDEHVDSVMSLFMARMFKV